MSIQLTKYFFLIKNGDNTVFYHNISVFN